MRFTGRVGLLAALWLLAWGEVSIGNVLSGLVVAAALLGAFPPPSSRFRRVRVKPLAVLRLAGYVAVQLVTSNFVMTGQVLRPRPSIRPGVLCHRLDHPSEHVVTAMTTVIALSPGTMTVDVDRTSSTIYVHFLFLRDIDVARAALEHLERLVTDAIAADSSSRQSGVA